MKRHPGDYLIAIKPDNTMVRCYDNNIPKKWALIPMKSVQRNTFYNIHGRLKPQYWGLPRYRRKGIKNKNILPEGKYDCEIISFENKNNILTLQFKIK